MAFSRDGPAFVAQSFTPDQADRAAAIKEGNLSWYSSTPFPLVQHLADKFTQDTGIKVMLLRSGGEAVLRRFLQEYGAGQAGADVITMSDSGAATGLARKGVFVPFKPDASTRWSRAPRTRMAPGSRSGCT